MIIEEFNFPRANNLPQQVEANRKAIKELQSFIKPYYKCSQTLDVADELVARAVTNVPEDIEKGFLVDQSGKLFDIIAITDADNLVIDFWAQLTIGG